MGLIFKDSGNKPIDPAVARKRAILFSLPFAAMGMLALIVLLHDGLLGGLDRKKLFQLLGVIAASVGFVALIFGVVGKKTSLATELKLSDQISEKPWLKRADWAAGKIKSAGIPHAKSYLTMGIALCVIGGLIAVLVIPKALRDGNDSALVAVIFPIIGIIFLISVVKKLLAHRRFGDCIFEMAQTPAPTGGALEGAIQTSLPLKFENELNLNLFCIRKTTSGAGQNRRTDEKILWRDKKIFKAGSPGLEAGKIPVQFDLPPGQPQCSERGSEAICWRLEMKIPAANFHATFDVPVFKITTAPAI
ncbi:MAG TPA: hypothetical protein VK810_02380 [Dongiaceae bacterium]|jgi:hypothetical protein|nr:hypothetical protein [Dongiaceae bacterium]